MTFYIQNYKKRYGLYKCQIHVSVIAERGYDILHDTALTLAQNNGYKNSIKYDLTIKVYMTKTFEFL
jgi:hypothetical protein